MAGVVLDERNRVLVIQRRDNGQWEPPGGVLELGETFQEGVRREVLEETGALVDVGQLTGVYKNMSRAIVALVFRCSVVSWTPVQQTDEAAVVDWLSIDAALERMAEVYKIRVLDALQSNDFTHYREHDGVNLLLHST